MRSRSVALALVATLLWVGAAWAQVPLAVGRVRDARRKCACHRVRVRAMCFRFRRRFIPKRQAF